MSWPGRPPRWHPLRSPPTRFGLLKLLVLLFFFVLVLAPFTGWLMSLPMWLMDVIGFMVSTARHSPAERWFRGALLLGGAACTVAVLWRAREDGDRDLSKRAWIAAAILAVYLAATYPAPRKSYQPRADRAEPAGPVSSDRARPAQPPPSVQRSGSLSARRDEAPPPLSLEDYNAVAERLVRGAVRSAADGDPFFRQQVSMLRELRKARAPGGVDSARYQAAMQDYRRLSGSMGAGSEQVVKHDAAIERALQSALVADPNSAIAARELGLWRLRVYLRALHADDARSAGDAGNLRKISEAARAGFIDALSSNPSYDDGWRALAWTWLYDDPDLAQGALTIEADQRFASGSANSGGGGNSAIDAAGAAQRPRLEVLQARARKTVMDMRDLSVPREVNRVAMQALPPGQGPAARLATLGATPDAARSGAANLGAVDLLADPWRRGALRVASAADQQAWVRAANILRSASFAPDFREVLLGVPRFRVVRGFDLPKGLDRVGPTVFLVPAQIERPRGELGNSLVLDNGRGDCAGRYCNSLVSLD